MHEIGSAQILVSMFKPTSKVIQFVWERLRKGLRHVIVEAQVMRWTQQCMTRET